MNAGLVVARSAHSARTLVHSQDAKMNLTYVATICDVETLQPHVPHFIIADAHRMTQEQLRQLKMSAAPNVHIFRNESKAGNNHILMKKILQAISTCLSHRDDIQPVLVLDVASCHIHKDVFQRAKDLGIWLVFTPAQITSLVPPLDTHAFWSFKAWLRRQYAKLRSKSPQGLVERLRWLQVLQSAKAEFFDKRSWVQSFRATGARLPCARLTKALSKYVAVDGASNAANNRPDAEGLQPVWPKRRRMAFALNLLFPPAAEQVVSRPSSRTVAQKRPLSMPAVSIALASRANKRACRQYPCRSTE